MSSKRAQPVYKHLVRKLSQGELPPGSRLNETVVAQEVGVSRTPVREAFAQLRAEGVLDVLPRFGWFVRTLSRQEIIDLYEVRELLECSAAALAAARAVGNHLENLAQLLEEMEASLREWNERPDVAHESGALSRCGELDRTFHETVFRAAGNPWIARLGNQISVLSRVFNFKASLKNAQCTTLLTLPAPERTAQVVTLCDIWTRSVRDHRQISQAIRRRDPERARRIMSRHIRTGLKTGLTMMEQWERLQSDNSAAVSSISQ